MFCFQCEQTAGCKACAGNVGVCGKKADTAQIQDTLTGALNAYDLSAGFKSTLTIDLPSEPVKSGLSPAGNRDGRGRSASFLGRGP